MKEITVQEFKEKLDNDEDIQVIDVREPFEYDIVNLGGELVPLANIIAEKDKIASDKPVIIHCRTGGRSAQAVIKLEQVFGFQNLYSLKGGILAYANEIDRSLPTY